MKSFLCFTALAALLSTSVEAAPQVKKLPLATGEFKFLTIKNPNGKISCISKRKPPSRPDFDHEVYYSTDCNSLTNLGLLSIRFKMNEQGLITEENKYVTGWRNVMEDISKASWVSDQTDEKRDENRLTWGEKDSDEYAPIYGVLPLAGCLLDGGDGDLVFQRKETLGFLSNSNCAKFRLRKAQASVTLLD